MSFACLWLMPGLLMFSMSLSASQDIAVIELRNRPAEDLQPLLLPMLNGSDSLVPNHMQLIIKADPATIREIRGLVEQLDRRPHRLLISVAQGKDITAESLNGGIGVGPVPAAVSVFRVASPLRHDRAIAGQASSCKRLTVSRP